MLAKHALSQLSYGPVPEDECLCWHAEPKLASTSPPPPVGLRRGSLSSLRERRLVGLGRLELPTSRLSSARSNQLSYKPLTLFLKRIGNLLAQRLLAADDQHKRSPWRVFVREERETKTAKSRQWSSTILKLLAPDVSEEVR
jgi:hypothetical protein